MSYTTSNPALSEKAFSQELSVPLEERMTIEGVTSKSFILLLISIATGVFGWQIALNESFGFLPLISIVVAFIVALVIIFNKHLAPALAPVYAMLQGIALGFISGIFNAQYEGIVVQAVLITLSIFVCMLGVYRFKIIQVTQKFKIGIAIATGGVALYYVINLIMSMFGQQLPLINSNSNYGIAFTLVVIVIAALNLVIDFDFIEKSAQKGLPKYMEWYASFGIFITVVWLYVEVLRLLGKIRGRR